MNNKKVWNRTVLRWDLGTNGFIAQNGKCFIDLSTIGKWNHYITTIWAIATADLRAVICLDVNSGTYRGIITDDTAREINSRLQNAFQGSQLSVEYNTTELPGRFQMIFALKRSFCDEAISSVRSIMESLGVSDLEVHLSNFKLSTSTHCLVPGSENEYMPFSEHLRMKHGLICDERLHHEKSDCRFHPFKQ